ncbi:hypothetical protein CWI39_2094p0010, partial [Hamiltosporidium magnivora]
KQQGVNISTNKQQGDNTSTNKQQGVNYSTDTTNKHPLNTTSNKHPLTNTSNKHPLTNTSNKHPLTNTTNKQHPLNHTTHNNIYLTSLSDLVISNISCDTSIFLIIYIINSNAFNPLIDLEPIPFISLLCNFIQVKPLPFKTSFTLPNLNNKIFKMCKNINKKYLKESRFLYSKEVLFLERHGSGCGGDSSVGDSGSDSGVGGGSDSNISNTSNIGNTSGNTNTTYTNNNYTNTTYTTYTNNLNTNNNYSKTLSLKKYSSFFYVNYLESYKNSYILDFFLHGRINDLESVNCVKVKELFCSLNIFYNFLDSLLKVMEVYGVSESVRKRVYNVYVMFGNRVWSGVNDSTEGVNDKDNRRVVLFIRII